MKEKRKHKKRAYKTPQPLTHKEAVCGVEEIKKDAGFNFLAFGKYFGFSKYKLSQYLKEGVTARIKSIVTAYRLGKEVEAKKNDWQLIDPSNLPCSEVLVYGKNSQYNQYAVSEVVLIDGGGGFEATNASGYPFKVTHYKQLTAPSALSVHIECTECDGKGYINLPVAGQEDQDQPDLVICPTCVGSGVTLPKNENHSRYE